MLLTCPVLAECIKTVNGGNALAIEHAPCRQSWRASSTMRLSLLCTTESMKSNGCWQVASHTLPECWAFVANVPPTSTCL
jgi:hypothetical protein